MSFLIDAQEKTFVVFSGARTGSSLLQYILWPYCRNNGYQRALGELFITKNWLYDTGEEIGRMRLTDDQTYGIMTEDVTLGKQRLSLIQKYKHQEYLFKLTAKFLDYGTESQLEEIFDRYAFIIIDRHDTREMALSLTIAMNSDLYTIRKRNEIDDLIEGRFDPDFHGSFIIDTHNSFQAAKNEIRKRVQHVHEIWYEDILKYDNPYQFLQELGIEDWKSVLCNNDELPYRVASLVNKESMIENIDEFNIWCLENGFTK